MDIKKLSKICDSSKKLNNRLRVKDSLTFEDVLVAIKDGKKVYNKERNEYFFIPQFKEDLEGIYGVVYPENEKNWSKVVKKYGEPGDADFFAYGFADGNYGKFGQDIFSVYSHTLTKYSEKDLRSELDDLDLAFIEDAAGKTYSKDQLIENPPKWVKDQDFWEKVVDKVTHNGEKEVAIVVPLKLYKKGKGGTSAVKDNVSKKLLLKRSKIIDAANKYPGVIQVENMDSVPVDILDREEDGPLDMLDFDLEDVLEDKVYEIGPTRDDYTSEITMPNAEDEDDEPVTVLVYCVGEDGNIYYWVEPEAANYKNFKRTILPAFKRTAADYVGEV